MRFMLLVIAAIAIAASARTHDWWGNGNVVDQATKSLCGGQNNCNGTARRPSLSEPPCQISGHRRKEGSAQKEEKITKIQIGRRLDSARRSPCPSTIKDFVSLLVFREPAPLLNLNFEINFN